MGDQYCILDAMTNTNGRAMLATIIRVEGSAYRKEGTMMLLTEDGKRYGILSGGCLEDDLAERAPRLWIENVSQTLVYDLSSEDDLSWGQGNGCNGTIHVLMEPVNEELTEHFALVRRELNEGRTVLHVKRLSDRGTVTDYLFHSGNNRWFGQWSGAVPNDLNRFIPHRKAGWAERMEPSERFFIQRFEPKPRLIIFGAGPDAKPLADFASRAGFRVVVADWRPALCNNVRFPEAKEWVTGLPEEIAADYPFSERDSVIVMTHHFQKDRQIIHALRLRKLQYIGLLGSKERTRRLLGGDVPSWLHSPVGLPIGAEGPDEIAISILADVIRVSRLRREDHDLGNLSGGRTKQENGPSQAVSAARRQTSGQHCFGSGGGLLIERDSPCNSTGRFHGMDFGPHVG